MATLLVISFGVNIYFIARLQELPKAINKVKQFSYLSPRVTSDSTSDILIDFLPLRKRLLAVTKSYAQTFAYHFVYLPTGSTLGLNGDVSFSAASLIKLPVVMAYFHQKERLQQNSDKTVMITTDDIDSGYGELWKKGPGTKINLFDAVKMALIQSDNTAVMVLAHNVAKEDFDAVYEGLDIDFKQVDNEAIITAQQYGYILKSLYFSSVLTQKDSQLILSLLTQSNYNDKLVAGVPAGIVVAHKVGQLTDQLFQDCGIVYLPKRPYMLCMVSRSDEKVAAAHMKEVSAEVYDFVSSVNNTTKD